MSEDSLRVCTVLALTSPHGVPDLWATPRTFRAAWFWFYGVFFHSRPSITKNLLRCRSAFLADLSRDPPPHHCCRRCLYQEGTTPNCLAERRAQNDFASLPAPARDARCSQAPEAPQPNRRVGERVSSLKRSKIYQPW